jgi:hypothetical protein
MTDTRSRPATDADTRLAESLKSQLEFQKKWQRLSMLAYVTSTIGVLFCSTMAILAAAKQLNELAAYLSAATTILVGLEKSMLFREKWKFHLAIATRLSVLFAEIEAGQVADAKVIGEYSSILKAYADSLPIAGRDDG